MSRYRSYFSKNATLIKGNLGNNSRNPVTEVSYGTDDVRPSRYIFDIDTNPINTAISEGRINPNLIVSHRLNLTNTIRYSTDYIGMRSYSQEIERASSFELDLFAVNEEWDEGSGYDFVFDESTLRTPPSQAVNWSYRKTNVGWSEEGAYVSGVTTIMGTQGFQNGSENLSLDITDYMNSRVSSSGTTEGAYGLGVKFTDEYEALPTEFRRSVAFHAKHTNTWYAPYVETVIDDDIQDDRNYFFLDKENYLYLYSRRGGQLTDVTVNSVRILDYWGEEYLVLSGESVTRVRKGIYRVPVAVDSIDYPDAVIFTDEWSITSNGKDSVQRGEFYLISEKNYHTYSNDNNTPDDYFFYFWGIVEGDVLRGGEKRRVKLTVKNLYPNQNNHKPLDLHYRVYTTVAKGHEIEIIPFSPVDRTDAGYEINLDSSWFVPQDYKLELRLGCDGQYRTKERVKFTVE